MLHSLALLGTIALFSSVTAQNVTWVIGVGNNLGDLVYNPPFINATIGDNVEFAFLGGNHTVTQSTLGSPCSPLSGGFDSGFKPSRPGSATPSGLPNFNITVTDDQPIYVYCRQGANTPESHCGNGMVFAVNPGSTFLLFQARANASLDRYDTYSGGH
ncbi:hypothetical protein V8E53_010663 [Lactarius tabidus]